MRVGVRRAVSSVWKLIGHLVLVHRLVLFFFDVHRFPYSPVHPVAFFVDRLGVVPVYDVVERDNLCTTSCGQ